MKNFIIILLLLAVIGGGAYMYLSQQGHDVDSIIQRVESIDVSIGCSDVENILVTSKVTVYAKNLSSRTHRNITARITSYDKKGRSVGQKKISFSRDLNPNQEISKNIPLPAKARSCDCILISSDSR